MEKARVEIDWKFLYRNVFFDIEDLDRTDEFTDQDYLDCVTHVLFFGPLTPEESGLDVLGNCKMRCHHSPVADMHWTTGNGHPMVTFGDPDSPSDRVYADVYRIEPDILDKLDAIAGPQYVRSLAWCQDRCICFLGWMYTKEEGVAE